MDWGIQFLYTNPVDELFVHRLFNFLGANGVKYNTEYPGSYFIYPEDPKKKVEHFEAKVGESTNQLAEIVCTYTSVTFA